MAKKRQKLLKHKKHLRSAKKTAIYASTKNKTKNHYDYNAEKEIKNEKIISHYQNKESFFKKNINPKTKMLFMLPLRTKLKTRFTKTVQSIRIHESITISGVTKQKKLLLDFGQ